MYKVKYEKYKNKYLELKQFIQNGGFILKEDFNICVETENFQRIIDKLKEQNKFADKLLGSGEFGSVYFLTKNKVLKLFQKVSDYEHEMFLSSKINEISSNPDNNIDNLPKFYEMCKKELNIDGSNKNYGIIVMENLAPINRIFQKSDGKYDTNLNDINLGNFATQLVSIYAIIHYFNKKNNYTIIHNDLKFDNLMLKEFETEDDEYLLKLGENEINIPYIKSEGKHYKLVLIDFGESFYHNSDITIDKTGIASLKYDFDFNQKNVLERDILYLEFSYDHKNLFERIKPLILKNISILNEKDLFN